MLKKCMSILVAAVIVLSAITASAFSFPEPDWGKLYYEKEDMVMEKEIALYAESSVDSAPFYGAKFEPRGGTYIGSIPENSEGMFPLGSYLTYIEHMYESDLYYPSNVMIRDGNVLATIGWTIHDMNDVNYDQVRKVLNNLNSYNKPMLIRFANEMNCSNLGDDPYKYVEVFRTVANMIHEYPNFAVVWSPNDLGALDRPFEYFYPGDEYVDWVGVSCYSVKYFVGNQNTAYKDSVYFMTGDFSWATNKLKPFMEFLKNNNINKPVMISEGGVATNNRYGEEYQSWNEPRLRNYMWYLVMKYPQIKLINYFDVYRDGEPERYNISDYDYAVNIFNEAKNSGAYITEFGASPEFVFQPANDAGTLLAENGKIKLYTLAYVPQKQDVTVNYYIDSNWYHNSRQIPYICNLDISGISDGRHTMKIETEDISAEYVFYKKGNAIRFGAEPDVSTVAQPEIDNTPAPSGETVTVEINGEKLMFDQEPILKDGRTLVPLRKIFEALGATVAWDDETQTVTAARENTLVRLTIGSNILNVNGMQKELDVPAQVVNGRTLVPVRAIADSFGCQVGWNGETNTVFITK